MSLSAHLNLTVTRDILELTSIQQLVLCVTEAVKYMQQTHSGPAFAKGCQDFGGTG